MRQRAGTGSTPLGPDQAARGPVDHATTAADRWRTGALLVANVAQVAAPFVGTRLGGRDIAEISDESPTLITPPGYAFAVRGPIYAATTAASVLAARGGAPATADQRRHAWWAVGAYGTLTTWACLAQSDRWPATPPVLALASALTGVAHARLQGPVDGAAGRTASTSTAMLLGWASVATLVDAASTATRAGVDLRAPSTLAVSAGGLGVGAGVLAAAVARSRRGALPLAATSGWALLTIATSPRPVPVRVVAGIGLAAIGAGLAFQRAARRRRTVAGLPDGAAARG